MLTTGQAVESRSTMPGSEEAGRVDGGSRSEEVGERT